MTARTKNTKTAPAYRCTECGWTTAKWVGRCGECQTWGTVEEAAGGTRARTRAASSVQKPAQPIAEVDSRVAAYSCPARSSSWRANPAWANPPYCWM